MILNFNRWFREHGGLSHGRLIHDENSGITLPKDVKFKTTFALCRIDTGSTFKLRYLTERWHFFNKELFGGDMVLPELTIDKAFKSPKTLGVWRAYYKRLTIAHKMFILPNDAQLLGTLVHEMAHQYDSEVLKTPLLERLKDGGHGQAWQGVMRSVGLTPDRYYAGDQEELLDSQERENLEKKRELPDSANKINANSFGEEPFLRVLYVSARGTSIPILVLNRKATPDPASDLYLAFDKKDLTKDQRPQWLRLGNMIKPTPAQLRKFPAEFNTAHALKMIFLYTN